MALQEMTKDIWSPEFDTYWRGITTNGNVNRYGEAVMGAGIAKEAAERYPQLSRMVAESLHVNGLKVSLFPDYKLFSFPTKYEWRHKSNLNLIRASCIQLREFIEPGRMKVVLPRPGCGLGQLQWENVKPILEESLGWLDNDIIIVTL